MLLKVGFVRTPRAGKFEYQLRAPGGDDAPTLSVFLENDFCFTVRLPAKMFNVHLTAMRRVPHEDRILLAAALCWLCRDFVDPDVCGRWWFLVFSTTPESHEDEARALGSAVRRKLAFFASTWGRLPEILWKLAAGNRIADICKRAYLDPGRRVCRKRLASEFDELCQA